MEPELTQNSRRCYLFYLCRRRPRSAISHFPEFLGAYGILACYLHYDRVRGTYNLSLE